MLLIVVLTLLAKHRAEDRPKKKKLLGKSKGIPPAPVAQPPKDEFKLLPNKPPGR